MPDNGLNNVNKKYPALYTKIEKALGFQFFQEIKN